MPQGWTEIELSKITDYKKGKKPKKMRSTPFKGSLVYLDIKAIEKGNNEIFVDSESSNYTDENDLIIVWDGARAGWVAKSRVGAIGSTIMSLTPKIDKDFLLRYIQTQFNYIHSNHRGTGIPHVDPDIFWNIKIPIAPLPEQYRIVAKLDAVMQKVESNKQRLEKIPKLLKRFRQSVLAAAVSGKLTEEWRDKNVDLESGGILLSKLNKARKDKYKKDCELAEKNNTRKPQLPRGLNDAIEYEIDEAFVIPNTWSWSILDKISTVALGGTPSRKILEYWNGDINWVSSGEVANNRITTTIEKITLEGLSNSNAKIYPQGTVLLAMIGEGKTRGQVSILNIEATTNQNVAGLLLNNDFINSEYVWSFLLSRYESLRDNGLGGAQPALNCERVGQIPIAIPPHEEQKEIVRRVEQLFTFADKIEARYTKAKAMLDKLPQSILAKAFRGELVPQDPNDEPASVLLARIKAEKEKLAKEKEDKKSKLLINRRN